MSIRGILGTTPPGNTASSPDMLLSHHHIYNSNNANLLKSPHQILTAATNSSVEHIRAKDAHSLLLDFFGM